MLSQNIGFNTNLKYHVQNEFWQKLFLAYIGNSQGSVFESLEAGSCV